jgi:hypothetical protein
MGGPRGDRTLRELLAKHLCTPVRSPGVGLLEADFSPGAHVPASSERQDSNLHGLGSRPRCHPLTHALSSLGSRRGSNPHLPVHSGMCRTTTSTATTGSGEGTRTPAKLIQSQLGAPGAPPIVVPRPRFERGSAGSKPAIRSTGPAGIAVRPSRIGLASTGYQPIALPLSYGRIRGAGIGPAYSRV